MDRFIPKICPKCGREMTRHVCLWDPPCDDLYYCSEHRGGCGFILKRRERRPRNRNWNPYKEKKSNK